MSAIVAIGAALATGSNLIASKNSALGDADHTPANVPPAVSAGAQDVTCARCAGSFSCGLNTSYCWCQTLPPLDQSQRSADLSARDCWCLRCLRAAVSAQGAA